MISLADGTAATMPGQVTLPIQIPGKRLRHSFQILLTSNSPMLIETDMWAKLRLSIPPLLMPNSPTRQRPRPAYLVSTGILQHTPQEKRKFRAFLDSEIAKFDFRVFYRPRNPHHNVEDRCRAKPKRNYENCSAVSPTWKTTTRRARSRRRPNHRSSPQPVNRLSNR
jgi:hypothetical protein